MFGSRVDLFAIAIERPFLCLFRRTHPPWGKGESQKSVDPTLSEEKYEKQSSNQMDEWQNESRGTEGMSVWRRLRGLECLPPPLTAGRDHPFLFVSPEGLEFGVWHIVEDQPKIRRIQIAERAAIQKEMITTHLGVYLICYSYLYTFRSWFSPLARSRPLGGGHLGKRARESRKHLYEMWLGAYLLLILLECSVSLLSKYLKETRANGELSILNPSP